MNFRLVIQRERPAKDIQIFAPNMESLRKAAETELSNLPRGTTASLYQTREERVGAVRVERKAGKVYLVEVTEEVKGNEAGNEASSAGNGGK